MHEALCGARLPLLSGMRISCTMPVVSLSVHCVGGAAFAFTYRVFLFALGAPLECNHLYGWLTAFA